MKAPIVDLTGVMDKNLTRNLKVSDMVINSGSSTYGRISVGFATALDYYIQALRDILKLEPTTSSVYRTWYHNCELDGSVINSNHIDGIAGDVKVGSAKQPDAAAIALGMFGPLGGIGFMKYKSKGFVHVDFGRPRKW